VAWKINRWRKKVAKNSGVIGQPDRAEIVFMTRNHVPVTDTVRARTPAKGRAQDRVSRVVGSQIRCKLPSDFLVQASRVAMAALVEGRHVLVLPAMATVARRRVRVCRADVRDDPAQLA